MSQAIDKQVDEVMQSAKLAFDKYKKNTVPDTAYKSYIKKYPGDMYAVFSLASLYIDQEKYPAADSLLGKVLNMHPRFLPALNMRAMVKRELNQPDSSLKYCDQILEMNHQNLYALSSKARTLIKKRKNTEALQMAKQVYTLDKNDAYNTSTLILAYHFNNDWKKRDEMVALARGDSTKSVYFKYVQDVISNKVKY